MHLLCFLPPVQYQCLLATTKRSISHLCSSCLKCQRDGFFWSCPVTVYFCATQALFVRHSLCGDVNFYHVLIDRTSHSLAMVCYLYGRLMPVYRVSNSRHANTLFMASH